ncbi:hypothetical protein AB4Z34_34695 [Ensifer sp. 2YAB10]|uniref:hypothetical protein n=1 Tax=Ensifer sp. 2YAB10 TaxID=3233021 RepID=UPI003F9291A3
MKEADGLAGAMARAIKSKGAKGVGKVPAQTLLDGFSRMHDAYADYQKVREQEKTKRSEILADRDAAIKRICAQRDIVKQALAETFELRKSGLQAQVRAMDKAIDSGNIEALHVIMASMVRTIESSPFKDLADLRNQLSKGDFVLDLK